MKTSNCMAGSKKYMIRADRRLAIALTAALCLQMRPALAEPPEPGLIEFLGTWETSDGQWVDPIDFAQKLEDATPNDDANDTGEPGRQDTPDKATIRKENDDE